MLCVDEKSQVQALDRTQQALPLDLGYVEGCTQDYVRHGTTTLFAALQVATGEGIARCAKRHRHQQYRTFLRLLDKEVPAALEIHLVVDNYTTPKHAKVRALDADLGVLDQPGRALVRIDQPARHPAWQRHQRDRSGPLHPRVHAGVQQGRKSVRMGRYSSVDPRQDREIIHAYFRLTTLVSCMLNDRN